MKCCIVKILSHFKISPASGVANPRAEPFEANPRSPLSLHPADSRVRLSLLWHMRCSHGSDLTSCYDTRNIDTKTRLDFAWFRYCTDIGLLYISMHNFWHASNAIICLKDFWIECFSIHAHKRILRSCLNDNFSFFYSLILVFLNCSLKILWTIFVEWQATINIY